MTRPRWNDRPLVGPDVDPEEVLEALRRGQQDPRGGYAEAAVSMRRVMLDTRNLLTPREFESLAILGLRLSLRAGWLVTGEGA